MASKNLKTVRRTQTLGQDRLITLLDKKGREIHTDPKEVPEITSWDVEAALRHMKNGTGTDNNHTNIETLKAGEDTISKTLAKLYTKCLSES